MKCVGTLIIRLYSLCMGKIIKKGMVFMKINTYRMMLEDGLPHLVKETTYSYPMQDRFESPVNVVEMMRDVFSVHKMAEEYVYTLCLNSANKPLDLFEISHGSVDSSIVNPREVLQRALLVGATKMILIHNHPSGETFPSKGDRDVTLSVQEACALMGIPLIDHVIVGNGYYSFKENHLL